MFQTETDIHFAYSFVAYVAFSSDLSSPRGSVFFSSHEEHEDMPLYGK